MESKPPSAYEEFTARFPILGEAWELLRKAAEDAGPLDARTLRLIKLAISVGASRQGAVRSATRRAIADGISREEVEQVIASAASTIGLPATVAAFTWTGDILDS